MATVTETGSRMAASASKRKRSRTETVPGDDADKRRGRPRVDRQDESAADRRRTQIRMAQRAYRQRKESTLEELRKRVSDLSNTVELMNKSFLEFSKRLQVSGLSQAQSSEVEDLSVRFDALIKDARHSEDEGPTVPSTAPASSNSSSSAANDLEVLDLLPQVRNVPSWLDQSAVSSEATRSKPSYTGIGMGYEIYADETTNNDDAALDLSTLPKDLIPLASSESLPLDSSESLPHLGPPSSSPDRLTFNNPLLNPDTDDPFPIPSQPSPPRTFSFQESTFARRLHRACLERAYQLLLDPAMRPATYERVFRLSLLGRSRQKIIDVVGAILARGPHQELNFWQAPLIHVGGAGTHYPPRDAFGHPLPLRHSRNIGRIGPQTLALLDNASREQIGADMTIEIAGYEGQWFDADDVQGYLEERGIFIDPSSTFAEAEIVVRDDDEEEMMLEGGGGLVASSSSSEMGGAAALATLPVTPSPMVTAEFQDPLALDTTTPAAQWDDLFPSFTDVGFSDAQTGSWMNFLQPGEAIKRPSVHGRWAADDSWMGELSLTPVQQQQQTKRRGEKKKKKIVIDVRKLVKALSTSGVCLGRSPGFRKRDVDLALKVATVEDF